MALPCPVASTLLAARTTGRSAGRSTPAISRSSAVVPVRASTTNRTRSASSTATSTCLRTASTSGSSGDGSKPPVSITVACQRSKLTCPYNRSRVTPGTSRTIARRRPTSRLKSVDLPTFGRPTIAMTGGSPRAATAGDSGVAQRREERGRRRLDHADGGAQVPPEVRRGQIVEEDAVHIAHGGRRHQHRAPQVSERREVALDVAPREEPRHGDRAPEELVRHGRHAHARPGEAAALEQRAEARRKHLARDERDGRGGGAARRAAGAGAPGPSRGRTRRAATGAARRCAPGPPRRDRSG